jgi:hypothetical protein
MRSKAAQIANEQRMANASLRTARNFSQPSLFRSMRMSQKLSHASNSRRCNVMQGMKRFDIVNKHFAWPSLT